MNLAVLHYHLNRGGVTKVIENQLRSLDSVLSNGETWQAAILYGGRCEGWPEGLAAELYSIAVGLEAVPSLEYDSVRQEDGGPAGDPNPQQLAGQIEAALRRRAFSPGETVLHVHNHSLGKNAALAGAVALLAERGWAMLLEPHDFAEDFRPGNFRLLADRLAPQDPAAWHGRLYPQASQIHYAVLNDRDCGILRDAGVAETNLHLLPNPVPELGELPPKDSARAKLAERFGVSPAARLVLYPVRGIRRKNVGEAVLYAALTPPETVIGITLSPLNPAEKAFYDPWTQFAAELELPIRFELGGPGGLDFTENMAASDAILTTSVSEGFGMVFLESWLARRGLVGRDLPEITADFVQNGLRLDGLRPRLDVPIDWAGAERFASTVASAYRSALAAFDRDHAIDPADVLAAKAPSGLVDFGDLDELLQREVIRRVSLDPAARRSLFQCNPGLQETVFSTETDFPVEANISAIEGHYAIGPSGRRLLNIYEQVAASAREPEPRPIPRPSTILEAFLHLARFRAIQS